MQPKPYSQEIDICLLSIVPELRTMQLLLKCLNVSDAPNDAAIRKGVGLEI